MHSLILLGWLGAGAPAPVEPVTIQVPTHTLAHREHTKGARLTQPLVEQARHAMSARIDSEGHIQYDCNQVSAVPDLRFNGRASQEER